MSATGLVTDAVKNIVANAYAGAALYLTPLQPLTLQTATGVGAATFTVDLSVAAGDVVVFDLGLASQETATVQSVTGSGPYVVTPTTPLTKAHATTGSNAGMQSHVPLTSATVHEVAGVTRVAASWGSPSPAGVITSGAGGITIGSSKSVGSVALFSASTAGTYYDASAVPPQSYPSGGTFTATWVETFA
jgi:hypothetical protein